MIAWLAVMERDARLYGRAIAAGGRLNHPATAARAEADLAPPGCSIPIGPRTSDAR